VREVQALSDVTVGQTLRRQLGDLQLLRRELVSRLCRRTAAALTGCTELTPRLIGPCRAIEGVEAVAGGAQRPPGFGDLTPAPQPAALGQQQAGALERPGAEI
jgi:hypothetical protein